MITADEARKLVNDDNVLRNKLKYLDQEIKNNAEMGYRTASVCVENPSVLHRIVNELKKLGYTIESAYDSVVTIKF